MLGKLKRITATILAIATVVTSIPVINVSAAGNGERLLQINENCCR